MKHTGEKENTTVGNVKTRYFTFAAPPDELVLISGQKLGPITIAYETYGTLNDDHSNAILILHALSGSAHAAGYHSPNDKYPGWWDNYIGPGKPFDTDRYFIICSNVIGGCNGSTGPSSINPVTGHEYGLDFPMVTIQDMVKAQRHLVGHLGIEKLLAVAGGSMGGMQALQWSILFPEKVQSVIAIATSSSLSAQGIAFNEVGRQAIYRDPDWNNGNYYTGASPRNGLSLARMIGHITYLSEKSMHEKFGRRLQDSDFLKYTFDLDFQVESYLQHQGTHFVNRFDANSYLYITKAIDYFDLREDFDGDLLRAFENVQANYLVVSFSSDWLYPSGQSRELVKSLRVNAKHVVFTEIESDKGHDTFLLPNSRLERDIRNFIHREFERVRKKNGLSTDRV